RRPLILDQDPSAIIRRTAYPAKGSTMPVKLDKPQQEALKDKRKFEKALVKQLNSGKIEVRSPPKVISVKDFKIGRFEYVENIRLEWIEPDRFMFIPKKTNPFCFVRANKERVEPRTFFTDGASIPRFLRWSEELDPFGLLPAALLHDWQWELHRS